MSISKVIKKYKINEQPNDFVFWQSRSYEERLEALEQIRKEYNSWRYNAEQGFQRVYRVVKLDEPIKTQNPDSFVKGSSSRRANFED